MGWFSKLKKFVKKAAPYIVAVVSIVAPELIPAIGTSLGASAANAQIVGAAALSGGSTALGGGSPEDILKSAAIAAGTTAIGQKFGDTTYDDMTAAQRTQYPGQAPDLTAGQTVSKAVQDLGGSPELGTSVAKGTGSFLTQTAGGLARGLSPEEAAKQGLITGGVTGLTEFASQKAVPVMPETSLGRLGLAAGETAVDYGLSSLFQPSQKAPSPGQTYDVSMTGMPGSSAGSQALSQALRLGDPGAPLFGSEKEGKRKNVWNVASLKVKDETGA